MQKKAHWYSSSYTSCGFYQYLPHEKQRFKHFAEANPRQILQMTYGTGIIFSRRSLKVIVDVLSIWQFRFPCFVILICKDIILLTDFEWLRFMFKCWQKMSLMNIFNDTHSVSELRNFFHLFSHVQFNISSAPIITRNRIDVSK